MLLRDRLLLVSRYTSCTPGVIDTCVRAVAAEAGIDDVLPVLPDLTAHRVALIAKDALEAAEAGDLEHHDATGSDHLLTLIAEARFRAGDSYERQGMIETAETARNGARAALEQVAASSDRSSVIWYGDIYREVAGELVRRGDRLGIVRQIEGIADGLGEDRAPNLDSEIQDLAFLYMHAGDFQAGLRLLTGLLRSDPSDVWSYNAMAIRLPSFGLRSLGKLAAQRGLELVRRGDPDRLEKQLRGLANEISADADRSEAPADEIENLRDALHHADFDVVEDISPRDLAVRLVPEVTTARVKALPPMPSPEALSKIAAGLRAVLRSTRVEAPSQGAALRDAFAKVRGALSATDPPTAPIRDPIPSLGTATPKVGRNDPCPCGSGKKFKKCCLGSTTTPGR